MRPYDFIAKKRDGGAHSTEELRALVSAVVSGEMPDYQTAAWLMAAFLRGLNADETLALTLAMRDSGERVNLDSLAGVKLDKHSSGGVGDKTTLVVVPVLAAAGVPMLKMSGRGLGFTGGTIDKLDAIPGMCTDLTIDKAIAQIQRIGAALVGQSPALVPADKKLYALRDVTATVESIPLIAASIMSKKLAAGATAVLLDVKVGQGAFMKTPDRAQELARAMVAIGNGAGVRTRAVLTAMDEPLGCAVGNVLEVIEACAVLNGDAGVDCNLRELCVTLCAHGLELAGKADSLDAGRALAETLVADGSAGRIFAEIIAAQGGDPEVVRHPELLARAPVIERVRAGASGWVQAIDAEKIGRAAMMMGAGRARKEDTIDPAVGLVLRRKVGDRVEAGDCLADMHLSERSRMVEYDAAIQAAMRTGKAKPETKPLVMDVIE